MLYISQNEVDDEDNFEDALDENDFYVEKGVDERKLNFKSLDDFMKSSTFNNPINIKVVLTVGQILLMVLKYALVHALSLTEITDLLNMLNCIFFLGQLFCLKLGT